MSGRNLFLLYQGLTADGTLHAIGLAGFGASCCLAGDGFLGVAQSCDFFLCSQSLTTDGTLDAVGQASLGTGSCLTGNGFFRVAQCINRLGFGSAAAFVSTGKDLFACLSAGRLRRHLACIPGVFLANYNSSRILIPHGILTRFLCLQFQRQGSGQMACLDLLSCPVHNGNHSTGRNLSKALFVEFYVGEGEILTGRHILGRIVLVSLRHLMGYISQNFRIIDQMALNDSEAFRFNGHQSFVQGNGNRNLFTGFDYRLAYTHLELCRKGRDSHTANQDQRKQQRKNFLHVTLLLCGGAWAAMPQLWLCEQF